VTSTQKSLTYIPVTPELARELGIIGDAARRRVVGWLIAIAAPGWIVGFQRSVERGSEPGAAALEATLIIAAMLAFGVVAAALWGRRIRSSRFIVREHGRFDVGGRFRARVSGDRTRRSIKTSFGEVMLDNGEHGEAMQTLWDRLTEHRGDRPVLEIDYTPNRHLLAVRLAAGKAIFTRAGYVAPPSEQARPLVRAHDVSWLGALWPIAAVLALALVSYASLAGFSAARDGSLASTVFLTSFGVTLVMTIGVATFGAYRLFIAIGELVVSWTQDRAR
jgi:hypothetical protein